jgi:signal transduction histidine kinase
MYYYTSIPASSNGKFSGVVVVGTSIRNILPFLKSTAYADIILYGDDGHALGSTLGGGDQDVLNLLSITKEEYHQSITTEDGVVLSNNIEADGRTFSVARGPLQVGNDRICVFAVALPLDFVLQSKSDTTTTYTILFTIVFFFVLGIGYVVSRMIINPIYSLVRTSQAITSGDLEQRTGIKSNDEIGTLANTFDEMTLRLQARTLELERSNQVLRNIDKTKSNFIQISAHELRTPITLILGYSQMLVEVVKGNEEAVQLLQGILEGSERMTDIVDNLLDVSRIDNNTLFPKKTNLRLDLLIKKVNKEFEKAF